MKYIEFINNLIKQSIKIAIKDLLPFKEILGNYLDNDGIKIKWPNDIYYEGKKLAGILTEASIDCERIKTLVFGIGLNVNINTHNFPKDLGKESISLQSIIGEQLRLHELAAKLIKVILASYKNKGLSFIKIL